MSMRKSIRDIYMTFINDETLLRLLYYPPENLATGQPDPLDSNLPNVLDMDINEKWAIIDDRILMTPTVSDLEGVDSEPKCRLLFYAGRRRATNSNFLFSNQDVVCDILCHFNFEKDQRSARICDQINELLFNKNITGIGKTLFKDGGQINAPKNYVGYKLNYELVNENY